MSSFTCCIWWLVFGILLGWLLAWWLSKCCSKKSCDHSHSDLDDSVNSTQNIVRTTFSESSPTTSVRSNISRSDMVKAAEAVGISFSGKKNDLEIVEGIGPKIAGLLNEHGIFTFEELSKASITSLNSILEQGGDKFRLANPSTWAEQALLAAENKWSELKNLQDSLDGGIKKS